MKGRKFQLKIFKIAKEAKEETQSYQPSHIEALILGIVIQMCTCYMCILSISAVVVNYFLDLFKIQPLVLNIKVSG